MTRIARLSLSDRSLSLSNRSMCFLKGSILIQDVVSDYDTLHPKFLNIRHYSAYLWDSYGNECIDLSTSKALGYTKDEFDGYIRRFKQLVKSEFDEDLYSEKSQAEVSFNVEDALPLRCGDTNLISLIVMRLIIKYGYTRTFSTSKFNILYTMECNDFYTGDKLSRDGFTTCTIGPSTSLLDAEGNCKPSIELYKRVYQLVIKKSEEYAENLLQAVTVQFYMGDVGKHREVAPSDDEINKIIWYLAPAGGGALAKVGPIISKRKNKVVHPDYIPTLSPSKKVNASSFIVADIETVIENRKHIPYSIGFLVVRPGDDIASKNKYDFECYYSEDYYAINSLEERGFQARSDKMLEEFLRRIMIVAKKKRVRLVYFHNLGSFDGILLLKYFATNLPSICNIRSVYRNSELYEIIVYENKRVVLRLRDSLKLLPGSLDSLAKTFCPELGVKGSFDHKSVEVQNLVKIKNESLIYMRQDIRLLGGIMLRAQEIYWKEYKLDFTNYLTVSSLSLAIFRLAYYDPKITPIHIPLKNVEKFIRYGYYGGHSDVYKPLGYNLYYYDVNSLYPYIMKEFSMPGGKGVWRNNLEGYELSSLCGFIQAYVICPPEMNNPFLPFKNSDGTLLFPTGSFVGIYYSEELIFAQKLGYKIYPIKGYLFEMMESPFKDFVSALSAKRQEAQKINDLGLSYIYKRLMNSLYGRFGIKDEGTLTEFCDKERHNYLIKHGDIRNAYELSERFYLVIYTMNSSRISDTKWEPPRLAAIQMSAAITACARIYMYQFIGRDDCFYTDTDSAVLQNPLPPELVDPTVLGCLKLEHELESGLFLAAKSYVLNPKYSEKPIIKNKGIASSHATIDWFMEQYSNLQRIEDVMHTNYFYKDTKNLSIIRKDMHISMGVQLNHKRIALYDENNLWCGTKPIDVSYAGDDKYQLYKLGYQLKLIHKEIYEFQKVIARTRNSKAAFARVLKEMNLLNYHITKIESENNKVKIDSPQQPDEGMTDNYDEAMTEEYATDDELLSDYPQPLTLLDAQTDQPPEEVQSEDGQSYQPLSDAHSDQPLTLSDAPTDSSRRDLTDSPQLPEARTDSSQTGLDKGTPSEDKKDEGAKKKGSKTKDRIVKNKELRKAEKEDKKMNKKRKKKGEDE